MIETNNLRPPVLTTDELKKPQGLEDREYPPVIGRDLIPGPGGQLLVQVIPGKRVRKDPRKFFQFQPTEEELRDIFTEVQDDLRRSLPSVSYGGSFWHIDVPTIVEWLRGVSIRLPIDVLVMKIPAAAYVAMSLRVLCRLLNPKFLRYSNISTILNYNTRIAHALYRGEEYALEVIRIIDALRQADRLIPGITHKWCYSTETKAFLSPIDSIMGLVILEGDFSIKRAVLMETAELIRKPKVFWSISYLAAVIQRGVLMNKYPSRDHDWSLEFNTLLRLPYSAVLPNRIRYGWTAGDYEVAGLTLRSVSETGQLVYADRFGKTLSEGLTMSLHPKVKDWGPNVRVYVTRENAQYFLRLPSDPPESCPWSWYAAWGDGIYNAKGESRGGVRVKWSDAP
jgi:hypothetical protein